MQKYVSFNTMKKIDFTRNEIGDLLKIDVSKVDLRNSMSYGTPLRKPTKQPLQLFYYMDKLKKYCVEKYKPNSYFAAKYQQHYL